MMEALTSMSYVEAGFGLLAVAGVVAVIAAIVTRPASATTRSAPLVDPQARLRQLGEDAARAERRLSNEIDLQVTIEEKVESARSARKSRTAPGVADTSETPIPTPAQP